MSDRKVLIVATVPSMIGMFNMSNIEILQRMNYEVHVACNHCQQLKDKTLLHERNRKEQKRINSE